MSALDSRWLFRAALLTAVMSVAVGAEYPDRAVRVVIPFTAGGGADNIGRITAEFMQKKFGQPFIVDNRPGAGANIGHEIVAKALPDGYTLIIATNSLPLNQALYRNLPFSATKSFTPIALIATSAIVIGTHKSMAAHSLKDLIPLGQKQPFTYSSCGIASIYHLVGERIKLATGMNLVHVPYKGCSQAIPDAVGGSVDLFVNALPNVLPHARSGKLEVFAVMENERSPSAPDIPTFKEATGLPAISSQGWYSLAGPAGLPGDIVSKLNRAVNEALESHEVRARLATQLYDIKGGPPAVLASLIENDIEESAKVIAAAHITPE